MQSNANKQIVALQKDAASIDVRDTARQNPIEYGDHSNTNSNFYGSPTDSGLIISIDNSQSTNLNLDVDFLDQPVCNAASVILYLPSFTAPA